MRKLTIDEVKNRLKEINPMVEILSDEYNGSKTKTRCRCLVDDCGNEWETRWDNLFSKRGCPECGKKKSSQGRKYTLEQVKSMVFDINPNIKIMNDEYVNSKSKLDCKCLVDGCGYRWKSSANSLLMARGCKKCAGLVRLTLDEVKNRLKDINPMVEIIDDTYVNTMTKLKCRCLKEGCEEEFEAPWMTLSKAHGCPSCGGSKPLTLEDVKDRLKEDGRNIKILSTEYKSSKSRLECKCLEEDCDNIWDTTWGSLRLGSECPRCKGVERLTIEKIKEEVKNINSNIIILSNNYVNNREKLSLKCKKDGYEWKASWHSISRKNGANSCPKCSGNAPVTIEEMRKRLSEMKSPVELLSNVYNGQEGKHDVRCKICGEDYQTTWGSLATGAGHYECTHGFLSIKRADRKRDDWEKISANLYLIRCFNEDENFLKVGITKNTLKKRFNKKSLPYSYESIKIVNGNLYDICILESEILRSMRRKSKSYSPNIKFAGYTECIDISELDFIKEFLAKKKVGELSGNN